MSANDSPIFVVGVPRSGTTLLAAMLAGHHKLSCGPETRFFHFLAKTSRTFLEDADLGDTIDFLFSLDLAGQPVPNHYGLSAEKLRSYLRTRPLTVSTLLSSMTEQFMLSEGKSRWVEKSPEHLLYVEWIRRAFPESPIIRIVRDPRDVALSLTKVPWGPGSFSRALFLWRNYDDQSARFFVEDKNSYTVKYEELVETPVAEIRKVCDFIGETYDLAMLDTSMTAEKLITARETHKRRVRESVDRSRILVWRRELTHEENRLAEAVIGDRMVAYGYECREEFSHAAVVFPALTLLKGFPQALAAFAEEGVRFWNSPGGAEIDISIFVGEPDNDKWLRRDKPGRWWDLLTIAAHITGTKLRQRRLCWVHDRTVPNQMGQSARLIRFFLERTANAC